MPDPYDLIIECELRISPGAGDIWSSVYYQHFKPQRTPRRKNQRGLSLFCGYYIDFDESASQTTPRALEVGKANALIKIPGGEQCTYFVFLFWQLIGDDLQLLRSTSNVQRACRIDDTQDGIFVPWVCPAFDDTSPDWDYIPEYPPEIYRLPCPMPPARRAPS